MKAFLGIFLLFFLSSAWGLNSEECEFSHNSYGGFDATDRGESLLCIDPVIAQSEVCNDFKFANTQTKEQPSKPSTGTR